MSDRYFVDEPISPGRVVLAGAEAHHLIHVMRAAPGRQIVLFDGRGAEFPATVKQVGRSDVELSVTAREEINRELPIDLTLGVALPKGERQKWLVEKAVEVGVTRMVPLRTERGVAQPVEQALSRLRRAVIEASKQCGRNRLLQIDEPQHWPDFLEAAAACRAGCWPSRKAFTGIPICPFRSNCPRPWCWRSDRRADLPARRRLWQLPPAGTPSTLDRARLRGNRRARAGGDGRPAAQRLECLPSPFGKGAGVRAKGGRHRKNRLLFHANRPHPNPLPEGEGTAFSVSPEKEGISADVP